MNQYYHSGLGREKAKEVKLRKGVRASFFDHSSAVLIEHAGAVMSLGAKRKETEFPPLLTFENANKI